MFFLRLAWTTVVPTMMTTYRSSSRHEMDMLSRFTGHEVDFFTKNWMRQHAVRKTYTLPVAESIRDIGLGENGKDLSIVSSKRKWTLDLENGLLMQQHKNLNPMHRYFLAKRRLYATFFDQDHHVVTCDDRPVLRTAAFPYFVRESDDEKTMMVGLCAENMHVLRLDEDGMPTTSYCVDTSDVTLASASCSDLVFNGMLNGGVVVRNLADDKDTFHVLRNPSMTIRSLNVEAIGSSVTVLVGYQDGLVKAFRYDPLVDRHTMHEFSNLRVREVPILDMKCKGGRVVTCDEKGHVVVSDVHGAKVMYDLRPARNLEGSGDDTKVDISHQYLVVACGNRIHVWDHDPPHAIVPLPSSARRYP